MKRYKQMFERGVEPGCQDGLMHTRGGVPAVCIRATPRGSLLTVLWVSIRPTSSTALPPPSIPPFVPGGGVGLAWRVSGLAVSGTLLLPFCCAAPLGLWVFGWLWFLVVCKELDPSADSLHDVQRGCPSVGRTLLRGPGGKTG